VSRSTWRYFSPRKRRRNEGSPGLVGQGPRPEPFDRGAGGHGRPACRSTRMMEGKEWCGSALPPSPDEVLLVVDSMIGQEAPEPHPRLPRPGGAHRRGAHQARRRQPRGGCRLSIRQVSGAPSSSRHGERWDRPCKPSTGAHGQPEFSAGNCCFTWWKSSKEVELGIVRRCSRSCKGSPPSISPISFRRWLG